MKTKGVEFSKLALIFSTVAAIGTLIFAFYMIRRTGDMSPLSYIIPAVYAELGTATGFYFWKARAENIVKISRQYGKETAKLAIQKDTQNIENNNYTGGISI